MRIRSIKATYICPTCKSRRELNGLKLDLINVGDLHAGHKGCKICVAEKIISILDILRVECEVEEEKRTL